MTTNDFGKEQIGFNVERKNSEKAKNNIEKFFTFSKTLTREQDAKFVIHMNFEQSINDDCASLIHSNHNSPADAGIKWY